MGGCLTGKSPRRSQRGASLLTQTKIVTNLQYINYLLLLIESNPHLTLLLHRKVFEDLKRIFLSSYWPEDKQTSLIRLLEDYIKYSVVEVSSLQAAENKPYDLLYFGEFYGKQMHKLQNQVKMKSHWMIDSLNFQEQFRNYNFSLEDTKQILKLTNDVKYLCSKEMLSIFYLSSYFVVCCEKMEKEGKSVKQILQALKTQVVMLKDEYGVKGMKKKQQAYINREDQSKEIKNIEEINIQVIPLTIKLQCQNGLTKQEVLENKIMDLVQFAKENIDFFNELIHAPCIQSEGFGFKSNLKLYSRENKLALHRVKEKLLKKLVDQKAKSRDKNQSIQDSLNIQQLIENQKKYLSNLMKQIYQKLQQIPFTVTDILRGKCLFNKVTHINRAVLEIKKKISAYEEKGVNVKLIEVENRLQKITKDLVLKIKIQDLVCQFQLVLFFNQAQNQIHHKMYELCRSKLLSEITLLYQWNKKSTKAYFSLLYNVINVTKQEERSQIQKKQQKLRSFLDLNKQDLKDRDRQEQCRKIKDIQVVNLSKNVKIEKQKIVQIEQGIKLRSLQYFIELKKENIALEIYGLPEIQSKNQYINSCQLNCLGGIYKNQSQYTEALKSYFKSLELKQNSKGRQSLDCAQVLNNIGIVYVNLKKYDDALEYYRQSLFIKKKVKGANSYECAQTLCNIGSAYDNMEKYQQALDYYDQSLSIKQDVKGRDSIECAQILNNIGLVYLKKGQQANAIDFLSRSLTVKQKTTGKDSMDCAQTLNNLGALYKKIKKYQEALDFFGRSLAIKQKIKGKQSLDCAQILNNIGSVYEIMGKHQESLSYFNRSLEINEKVKGKQSKQYEKIHNIITIMLTKYTSPKNALLTDVTNNLRVEEKEKEKEKEKENGQKEMKNEDDQQNRENRNEAHTNQKNKMINFEE